MYLYIPWNDYFPFISSFGCVCRSSTIGMKTFHFHNIWFSLGIRYINTCNTIRIYKETENDRIGSETPFLTWLETSFGWSWLTFSRLKYWFFMIILLFLQNENLVLNLDYYCDDELQCKRLVGLQQNTMCNATLVSFSFDTYCWRNY